MTKSNRHLLITKQMFYHLTNRANITGCFDFKPGFEPMSMSPPDWLPKSFGGAKGLL